MRVAQWSDRTARCAGQRAMPLTSLSRARVQLCLPRRPYQASPLGVVARRLLEQVKVKGIDSIWVDYAGFSAPPVHCRPYA